MARPHVSSGTEEVHGAVATPEEVTQDLVERHQQRGGLFRAAVMVCGALFVLGVISVIVKLVTYGTGTTWTWGYHASMFSFVLTTAQAAPMVPIATRIVRAHWARSISRSSEIWVLVGVIATLLYIPLLWVLPSLEDGRRSMWFFEPGGMVPAYSPQIWSSVAFLGLFVVGIALLWLSSLPDLAYMRDHGQGRQQRWARKLARGWIGTSQQWFMLHHRMGIVGAFYFIMLITAHYFLTTDFLMTLVPGWVDSLFPATHGHNALQAGIATVVLTMFVLRQFGGYKDYITLDQFWSLGRLLFAASLLWIWFWFSSFIVLWYGKKPPEQFALALLMTGPYLPLFYASFTLNFLAPLFLMMWNPVRKSIWGPTLVAVLVLFGMLFDQMRLFVAAYSVPGIGDPAVDKHVAIPLSEVPNAILPSVTDIFIILGTIGGAVLLFLLATRVIPVMSLWEQRELLLYKVHKPFHRTRVLVLGKPE